MTVRVSTGSTAGDGDRRGAVGDRAADLLERAAHLLRRVLDAHEPGGLGDLERDRLPRSRLGGAVEVAHRGVGGAAAQLDQQVDDPLRRDRRQQRVDAALEPLGGLAGELVPARRAGDGDLVEVGRLDEHVRRGVADLGRRAAHDAGEAEHAAARAVGRVGDQEVLGVQRAVGVVQGGEALAGRGPADHDRGRDLGEVVGVQRLPEVEHHVVRDVDGQGDRPHAGALEAVLHPRGRGRGRVDAAHDARDERGRSPPRR